MTLTLQEIITSLFAAQCGGGNQHLLTHSDDRDHVEISFSRASSDILSQSTPLSNVTANTTSSLKTVLRFRTRSETFEMGQHSRSLLQKNKGVRYEPEKRDVSELKFQFCAKMTKVEQRIARRRSRDFRSSLEPIMEGDKDGWPD